MDALAAHAVPAFVVRTETSRRRVGVLEEHRAEALEALAAITDESVLVRVPRKQLHPCRALATDASLRAAPVLRLGHLYQDADGPPLGFTRACDVEFWTADPDRPGVRRAPQPNVAAQVIDRAGMELRSLRVGDRTYPTPEVFTRRMVGDIAFPVDVVYAWVDGDDPAWRARYDRVRAEQAGSAPVPVASDAVSHQRFRSRDELRYSMRSLHMFAPWVRNVFLVTDDQVPAWLDTDHPRLQVLSHAELFQGATLPTFNSNVISSFLHRIEGLSEQFLYINDDIMLGREVTPGHFFTPAGLVRTFSSATRRPFGEPSPVWTSPENVAHNIRRLLEREHGVTLSHAVMHTPVAMLRSELARLERLFADEYAATRSHQFRHQGDIAPGLLFHYHAQIVGLGVASSLAYEYLNLGNGAAAAKLERLLAEGDRDVFCLNDVVSDAQDPVPDEVILDFLERYYPVRSPFER